MVLEVNTIGTFNVNRLAVALIAKNQKVNDLKGVVINTASVAAFDGQIGISILNHILIQSLK